MTLPIFNLAETIATYNQKYKCNYAPDEDFGFGYFSKEILMQADAMITLANSGIDRYLRTSQEKAFLKKRKVLLQRHTLSLNDAIEAPIYLSFDDEETRLLFEQKVKFRNWQDAWVKKLSKPETWKAWSNIVSSSNKARLLELQKEWEKEIAFACHTHDSLISVGNELLPDLITHHKSARRQLFWSFWEMPSDIWSAYKCYIDNFLLEAEKSKQALASNMLIRLQAWDKDKSTNGHTLVHLHQELKRIGAIPKEEKQPVPYETLTAKQFSQFHHTIEQYGDAETKQAFQKLSWFSKDNTPCPTQYVETGSTSFLVPEEFAEYVPKKLGKPAWLYRGDNLRHQFFQEKSLLFVSLKSFPEIDHLNVDLRNLSNIYDCLNDLERKKEELTKEFNKLKDPAYQELGFFQRYTKQFLREWQAYLIKYQYKIIESKLLIVENITTQLQNLTSMDSTLNAWSACSLINNLIKELKNDFKDYPSADLQNRLTQVEKHITHALSNYRVLNLIQKVSAGKVLDQANLEYLLDVTKAIRLCNKEKYADFQEICKPHFTKIRQLLDYELKANPRELHNPELHADRILLVNTVLDHCCDEVTRQENKQRIFAKIPKYFLKYLETLLHCGQMGENFERYRKSIDAFEKVMGGVDTGLLFANKALHIHIETLQKLRSDALSGKGSWVLVHARCQALSKELLSIYLDRRIQKDLATFDRQLFDFIKTDLELPFTEDTVGELQKLSDSQINQNISNIEELSLTPEQKTITGLNGGNSTYIRELLELRRHTHLKQRQILSKTASIAEKTQHVKTLATDLKQGLQKNSKQSVYALIGYTASGRRELFTKSYFDTRLLNPENKSHSSDSTLLLVK